MAGDAGVTLPLKADPFLLQKCTLVLQCFVHEKCYLPVLEGLWAQSSSSVPFWLECSWSPTEYSCGEGERWVTYNDACWSLWDPDPALLYFTVRFMRKPGHFYTINNVLVYVVFHFKKRIFWSSLGLALNNFSVPHVFSGMSCQIIDYVKGENVTICFQLERKELKWLRAINTIFIILFLSQDIFIFSNTTTTITKTKISSSSSLGC
jgi:succinate dehydrogenase hydrophobic anchor subunit